MKRTPLRKVSPKRAILNREYSRLRNEYLTKHPYCQWHIKEFGLCENLVIKQNGLSYDARGFATEVPRATDIHHRRGRGRFLLDVDTWMGVCRWAHERIHNNPKESYQKGYLLKR